MATGNYGITRPATVKKNDMEIFYTFAPNRDVAPTIPLTQLDPNTVITEFNDPIVNNSGVSVFNGLYNLTLPVSKFSTKGIYNIFIRPKEIKTKIIDCGVLSAFPEIKGVVLDLAQLGLTNPSDLTGYRIEYFDTNGIRIPNFFRVITSANKAEPVTSNLNNTTQKSVKYRFNDSSNLVFCTVTPSTAPNVKPNNFPDIGSPNQSISVTNTFFNPVLLEVDMVEYDIETLAYGIFGNQIKSIVDGKYTIYDSQNNIYKQYNLYEIQDQFTGEPLHEVRQLVNNIDFTKDFNTITNIPTA